MNLVLRRCVVFASITTAILGCGRDRPSATEPNVLLIAVDTLRADKLGCYGSPRGLTPAIDRLAASGARFESAFSHASWTLPSFASLFTSQLPQQHGAGGNVRDPEFRRLDPAFLTLAEHLQSAGMTTAAIVNVDFLAPPFGLMQGFDHVDARFTSDNPEMRGATETTDAALAWLGEHARERFFLFVHYFDPHAQYAPPQPFRRKFADPRDREASTFDFGAPSQIAGHRRGVAPLAHADIRRAEALYDGEVAYTDDEVGRLLAGLAELGLTGETLVVFTADHGEEFLDHGDYEHGHTLYDELLHVPLIVSQPGRIAPAIIAEPAGHLDVAPFICAWAGIAPSAAFGGHDFSPALNRTSTPPHPLIAYGSFWGEPLQSIRKGDEKLILTPGSKRSPPRRELYRWMQDRKELHDVAAQHTDVVRELATDLELLERIHASHGSHDAPGVKLSPEELARVRALGYSGEASDGR